MGGEGRGGGQVLTAWRETKDTLHFAQRSPKKNCAINMVQDQRGERFVMKSCRRESVWVKPVWIPWCSTDIYHFLPERQADPWAHSARRTITTLNGLLIGPDGSQSEREDRVTGKPLHLSAPTWYFTWLSPSISLPVQYNLKLRLIVCCEIQQSRCSSVRWLQWDKQSWLWLISSTLPGWAAASRSTF